MLTNKMTSINNTSLIACDFFFSFWRAKKCVISTEKSSTCWFLTRGSRKKKANSMNDKITHKVTKVEMDGKNVIPPSKTNKNANEQKIIAKALWRKWMQFLMKKKRIRLCLVRDH